MHLTQSEHSNLRSVVQEELEILCASDAFRHSRQTTRLLRYLVDQTLNGADDQLKERAIGTRIFGRDPGYDTNGDSIVRVGVAELRKRLSRAYKESDRKPSVQFAVPVGSYRVEFRVQEEDPAAVVAPAPLPPGAPVTEPAPPVHAPARPLRLWMAVPLACLFLVALGWYGLRREQAVTLFWEPVLKDGKGVVVLAPHPTVYTFRRETFQRFRGDNPSHAQRQLEALHGPPDATISLRDVVPIQDQYVGKGSAHAISDVSALFAVRKAPYRVLFGGEHSFQDIRDGPAVLVGAYANRWTLQLTDDLRFVLSERGGVPEIVDRVSGTSWAVPALQPNGRTPEDYIIVSRILHPQTGRLLVALAGITQYGTQAAGEFVTDDRLLSAATKDAPAHWERGNVQYVLHVKIVEGVPGRPSVVASHYWAAQQ